jgi:hypothetical protein
MADKAKIPKTRTLRSDQEDGLEATLARLETAMLAMTKKIDDNSQTLNDSMAEVSKKITDNEERINKAIDEKIADLREELKKDLTSRINQNEKDTILNSKRIDQVDSKIGAVDNKIDMLARQNDLIVKGIPTLTNEKTLAIYHKIATAIGFSTETAPFVQIYRMGRKKPGSNVEPPLLVNFMNSHDKTRFYDKYFERKNLKLVDIGIDADQRIYINENLSPLNQKIYAEAMRRKREGKFFSVSTFHGVINVKQKQDGRFVPVRDLTELERY